MKLARKMRITLAVCTPAVAATSFCDVTPAITASTSLQLIPTHNVAFSSIVVNLCCADWNFSRHYHNFNVVSSRKIRHFRQN